MNTPFNHTGKPNFTGIARNDFIFYARLSFFSLIFLLLFFLAALNVSALSGDVKISSFVNDYANIITPEDRLSIESLLNELYLNNTAQVAIVTINTLNGTPIEDYSMQLAHKKLGDSKTDNGLLYLVVLDDHSYRIEVGYGLEEKIPDIIAGRIGRSVATDYFKNGEYSKGILNATEQFYRILSDPNYVPDVAANNYAISDYNSSMRGQFIFFLFIFIAIFVISVLYDAKATKQRKQKKNQKDDSLFETAVLASLLFGGRRGGGFGGLGGGSGGFGGFGGGGFGGGGAGGKW